MSGYFRDRYQGVGAIAAAAPAPRSAPAPTFGRMARTMKRAGGRCGDCLDLGDRCDCSVLRSGRVRAMSGLGRIQVDDGGGGGGGGGRTPTTTTSKSPLRQIMPGVLAPPVRTTAPTKPPLLATQPLTMVATAVPSPGYLPPRTPVKTNTAGGGAGYPGSPAYTGGGGAGGALTQMAPPDLGPELEPPPGSAMTGGLPGGAAKLWVALGLGAAAFFTYRHFKKRRRR